MMMIITTSPHKTENEAKPKPVSKDLLLKITFKGQSPESQ